MQATSHRRDMQDAIQISEGKTPSHTAYAHMCLLIRLPRACREETGKAIRANHGRRHILTIDALSSGVWFLVGDLCAPLGCESGSGAPNTGPNAEAGPKPEQLGLSTFLISQLKRSRECPIDPRPRRNTCITSCRVVNTTIGLSCSADARRCTQEYDDMSCHGTDDGMK